MDILGRSYLLIISESLRVKQYDVIHCHLNFTQVWNIVDINIPYKFVQTAAYLTLQSSGSMQY